MTTGRLGCVVGSVCAHSDQASSGPPDLLLQGALHGIATTRKDETDEDLVAFIKELVVKARAA